MSLYLDATLRVGGIEEKEEEENWPGDACHGVKSHGVKTHDFTTSAYLDLAVI